MGYLRPRAESNHSEPSHSEGRITKAKEGKGVQDAAKIGILRIFLRDPIVEIFSTLFAFLPFISRSSGSPAVFFHCIGSG